MHAIARSGAAVVASALLALTPAALAGPDGDCNMNGVPDADEIAADPRRDCYDWTGPLGTMGGPDGILDVCQCPGNWNRDHNVNSTDLSLFIVSWLASVAAGDLTADFDCSGAVNSGDISGFITRWLLHISVDIPYDNCP